MAALAAMAALRHPMAVMEPLSLLPQPTADLWHQLTDALPLMPQSRSLTHAHCTLPQLSLPTRLGTQPPPATAELLPPRTATEPSQPGTRTRPPPALLAMAAPMPVLATEQPPPALPTTAGRAATRPTEDPTDRPQSVTDTIEAFCCIRQQTPNMSVHTTPQEDRMTVKVAD